MEKKYSQQVSEETLKFYEQISKKYNKDDLRNSKLNYWWAGDLIKKHNSIKEIMKLALDSENETKYLIDDYNLYSEFSHVSSYVVGLGNHIDEYFIKALLMRSIDMNFYIMQLYIGWLLDKTPYQESQISYIKNVYKKLRKVICNVQEPQKTFQEIMELLNKNFI
jgi:hypothetical protein